MPTCTPIQKGACAVMQHSLLTVKSRRSDNDRFVYISQPVLFSQQRYYSQAVLLISYVALHLPQAFSVDSKFVH